MDGAVGSFYQNFLIIFWLKILCIFFLYCTWYRKFGLGHTWWRYLSCMDLARLQIACWRPITRFWRYFKPLAFWSTLIFDPTMKPVCDLFWLIIEWFLHQNQTCSLCCNLLEHFTKWKNVERYDKKKKVFDCLILRGANSFFLSFFLPEM